MYIRFVVGSESDSQQKQYGIFTEVEHLRLDGLLEDYQERLVKETFNYFNKNLPIPPYNKKGWSTNTFAWFKDSAEDYINRMWELVAILKQNDRIVRILKTDKPGMILYEDSFQIVAQSSKARSA